MSTETLFMKIIKREIKANIVFEDDDVLAFRDINPQAPAHILIIPKKPIATLNDLQDDDAWIIGRLVLVARQLAAEHGFAEEGYRLVMNCNEAAGQTVFHVHLHLLGGRSFSWPPG